MTVPGPIGWAGNLVADRAAVTSTFIGFHLVFSRAAENVLSRFSAETPFSLVIIAKLSLVCESFKKSIYKKNYYMDWLELPSLMSN